MSGVRQALAVQCFGKLVASEDFRIDRAVYHSRNIMRLVETLNLAF